MCNIATILSLYEVMTQTYINQQLISTFARTNSTFHSFFYSSVRLWNALNVDVVNSPTISYYKNSLKLMYL